MNNVLAQLLLREVVDVGLFELLHNVLGFERIWKVLSQMLLIVLAEIVWEGTAGSCYGLRDFFRNV